MRAQEISQVSDMITSSVIITFIAAPNILLCSREQSLHILDSGRAVAIAKELSELLRRAPQPAQRRRHALALVHHATERLRL